MGKLNQNEKPSLKIAAIKQILVLCSEIMHLQIWYGANNCKKNLKLTCKFYINFTDIEGKTL